MCRSFLLSLSILLAFWFAACSPQDPNKTTSNADPQWPAPDSVLSMENTHIPVYGWEKFDRVIHNHQDDTTYVFNFWATWCKPCIQELPLFEQLAKQYAQDKVRVILVSMDFPEAYRLSLLPYAHKKQFKSTVVVLNEPDADKWIDKVHPKWSGAIPFTLIVNGKDSTHYEGKFQEGELLKVFKSVHGD